MQTDPFSTDAESNFNLPRAQSGDRDTNPRLRAKVKHPTQCQQGQEAFTTPGFAEIARWHRQVAIQVKPPAITPERPSGDLNFEHRVVRCLSRLPENFTQPRASRPRRGASFAPASQRIARPFHSNRRQRINIDRVIHQYGRKVGIRKLVEQSPGIGKVPGASRHRGTHIWKD